MLDFKMKHEGEPPARLLAGLRMRLKEKGLPLGYAEFLAPIMAAPEDMDDETAAQIAALAALLEKRNIPADEARAAIEAAIAELIAEAQPGDDDSDEGDDMTALFRQPQKQKRSLASMVFEKVRAASPKIHINSNGPNHRSPQQSRAHFINALSDGVLARMDRKHTPTIGREYAALSLGELAMASERAAGRHPKNIPEAVRMATHTGSDFPLVLENALGKSIERQMEQLAPAIARAAHEIDAKDYRGGKLLGLSASGMPDEIGEGGEIKHVTIDERGEQKPAPRDFGAMFTASNKAIVNDDLGLFDQISKKMVAGAIERQRRVLLEPLLAGSGLGHTMADGKTVFHADHGNLATAAAAISVASLSLARVALRSQRGLQGEYYAIEPWALVVPPQLETTAQKALADLNATSVAEVNPFSGTLELIVEPGLTSATAWYLMGNPATTDGLAYSYLDGQKAPKVESKPGWSTLGVEFRLVWALDARFVNYASWYRNPGA